VSRFWHSHNHSKFSALDGMADVPTIVSKAVEYGQPAIALTDHGNMAGTFQLYSLCKAHDIKPVPGIEAYIVPDIHNQDAQRYHVGLLALDYEGYKALVKLTSQSFVRPAFYRKPRIDFAVLAELHDSGLSNHLALTTGCYFGMPIQALVNPSPPANSTYRTDKPLDGSARAEQIIRMYASWFPNTYVEVQQHYTPHPDGWSDIDIAIELLDIADRLGLPMVTTQDCHYCDLDHKSTHTLMKRLTMHGADPGDVGFPGDHYSLCSGAEVKRHYADSPPLQQIWNRSLDSLDHLYSKLNLSIPALDTYQFRIPETAKDPVRKLRSKARASLDSKVKSKHLPSTKRQTYSARIEEELAIINDTGFADYFLLVEEVVGFCHDNSIVVQARGSANGSLVCWLLGITSIDPIKWDIPFSAFLTNDRAKPPDIDLDIEKGRRGEVAAWVGKRFSTVQLGTWRKLAKAEDDEEDEGKGSLLRSYASAVRREIGPDKFDKLVKKHGNLWSVAKHLGDADDLNKLDALSVYSSPGTHAAGFVLDPGDGLLAEIVPTMLIASSDTIVTQVDMDDAESAGFVKLDLLGLRTLSSTKRCLELMGETWDFMESIPLSDSRTYTMLSRGIPHSGIFQAEGYSTAKGMRKMRPKNIRDVIDAMAVFRPATMQSGYTDLFLRNRRDPDGIRYRHEILEAHLSRTYGVFLYQEQVLDIARAVGLVPVTVQRMLKAIKVKHGKFGSSAESTRIFEESQEAFIQACVDHGMSRGTGASIWEMIEGFQRYSFKKAHATPYGLLCYRTAWLKTHHPAEFHAALLETIAWADQSKEGLYVAEVRRVRNDQHRVGDARPLRLLSPHVNESGWSWTLNKEANAIRAGLLTVHGVGQAAAQALVDQAPYKSLQDMVDRLPAKAVPGSKQWLKTGDLDDIGGVYRALITAGALDGLELKRIERTVRIKKGK
jgi:DNA polymerase-3 subunit alpha